MGCQLSSNAVRPREVYDAASDVGIVSLDIESLEQIARGGKKSDVREQFILNKKPKTSNIAEVKKQLVRKLSLQSYNSALSLDSGMGSPSTDNSQLFRNALKKFNYSIDTSKAKTNAHVVSVCAQKLNIEEYPEGRNDGRPCSIYWHSLVYNDMKNYIRGPDSRVNKFPGMTEMSRKVALTRAIRSMKELFPSEYSFYPRSFILPSQYDEFRAFAHNNQNKWFIIKPDEGCQGTGIYLANSPEQLHSNSDKMLIQEYVDDPYLLPDNLKFDFRVYAVIRSINPLSIYIAREGMARFCTEKYLKPTAGNMTQLYSHLTNYSLNKSNSNYVHSRTLKEQLGGSKRLLSTVFHQMESNGVKTRKLWHEIKMIIVKTVLAMVPEIMINYEHYFCDVPGPQCFQIIGFDIIVRKDGFPFLLEVNSSPSLTIDHTTEFEGLPVRSIVDEMIKLPLVRDCMLLVLNQLDDQLPSTGFEGELNNSNNNMTEDDLALLKKKQKSHLSEIFPARYGHNSKHLLILDRAVYLFIQFVNIKLTLNITLLGTRAFIKKCNLTDVVSFDELERHFASISYYFHGQNDSIGAGLPFHGFLQLLFRIANIKFGFVDDQLAALQRLFAFCDASLRHYGIRSTRLRRTEIEGDENANVEIYLLPNRMRKSGRQSHRRRAQAPSYNTSAGSLKKRSRSMVQRASNQNSALTRLPPVTTVH